MKLLSLDDDYFSEWWANSAQGEMMVVQPKFVGCGLNLCYQSGIPVSAFTKSVKDVVEVA
tara:strand:- start:979 stop:1158 length:180 start_codon:yes stop_codon:yes gene_type:complete